MRKYLTLSQGRPLGRLYFWTLLCGVFFVELQGCDLLTEESTVSELSNPIYRMFEGRLTYSTGAAPIEVLIGDINRDGMNDAVTLDWSDKTLSVLIFKNGVYEKVVSYAVNGAPRTGSLTRLNNDAWLDIALINDSEDKVLLLFGNPDTYFDEPLELGLPEGTVPTALLVYDLDRSGFPEIITANSGTDSVSIFMGVEDGDFLPPIDIAVGQEPAGLWAGNLGQEDLDAIVVSNSSDNTLSILEYTGTTYEETKVVPCGNGPRHLAGSDLNRDGFIDLIVANLNSGDLSILFGLGEGIFRNEIQFAMPGPVARFTLADFDGNTLWDVAAVLFDKTDEDRKPASTFCVALGDVQSTFKNPSIYGAGWGAIGIVAADMNGDNCPDLITSDLSRNTISIAYNRCDGTFQSDRRFALGRNPGPGVVADFTQDGYSDLAVGNQNDNTVSIMAGLRDTTFQLATTLFLISSPLALAAGDINKDGKTDLVVALNQQYELWVFIASGPGTFLPPTTVRVIQGGQGALPQPKSIALGDINNDTHIDIVTGNSKRDSVSVLLGDGVGRFQTPIVTAVDNYPLDIHLRDINLDGKLDLVLLSRNDPDVVSDSAEPRVARWFGNGDGTFDADTRIRVATGSSPTGLRMADISGNGRQDAVTLHPSGNCVYLLEGVSSSSFSSGTKLVAGTNPIALALADIRKDGKFDLICGLNKGSVMVRLSRGALAFEGYNNFIVQPGITNLFVADFNNDLFADLVTINNVFNGMSVLRGCAF